LEFDISKIDSHSQKKLATMAEIDGVTNEQYVEFLINLGFHLRDCVPGKGVVDVVLPATGKLHEIRVKYS